MMERTGCVTIARRELDQRFFQCWNKSDIRRCFRTCSSSRNKGAASSLLLRGFGRGKALPGMLLVEVESCAMAVESCRSWPPENESRKQSVISSQLFELLKVVVTLVLTGLIGGGITYYYQIPVAPGTAGLAGSWTRQGNRP